MIKVLNLYAGIGGNRKLWDNVEVTAVELNPKIAEIYKEFFPKDKVVVSDAHEFLLNHFEEFDFIWSSPPCPSHSRMRLLCNQKEGKVNKYPDMKLYEEIILLKHFFKGKYCIENVISYYEPLIKPYQSGNHYFWSNFFITEMPLISLKPRRIIRMKEHESIKEKEKLFGITLNKDLNARFRRTCLNNCVEPELGKHIFNCAFKEKQSTLIEEVIK